MKSLQNQYNQINEGKGHKDMFMKSARKLFPQYITNFAPYKEVVTILKQKGILSENIGGVVSKPAFNPFQAFNTFINEEAKAIEKKPTTDVVEKETAGFDYKNRDNIDNVYGTSFLQGFYAEMQDPKNTDKTVDELKKIVAKNMTKDFNYYMKNAAFGIKGLGYQTSKEPKAPTGKYKSSGYGNLKENKLRSIISSIIREELKNESYDYETQADLRAEKNEESLEQAIELAKAKSAKEGVVQHVNQREDGSYEVSDWYDSGTTVFSYENGEELLYKEETVNEGALDNQIAAAEALVAKKKKELADAEKKLADIKAKEAAAEAAG
jgi:hypothetical protein